MITRINPEYQPKGSYAAASHTHQLLERVELLYGGNVGANVTLNIANNDPHAVFVVFWGTWNYSGVYLVFPNNGSTPVSVLLGKHGSALLLSVSAYGTWGISLKNPHGSVSMPATVLKVLK